MSGETKQPFLTSFIVRKENMLWVWPEKIMNIPSTFSPSLVHKTLFLPHSHPSPSVQSRDTFEEPLGFIQRLEPGDAEGETRVTAQKGGDVWAGSTGRTSCPVTPMEMQPHHSFSHPPCAWTEGRIWTLSRKDRKGDQFSLNKGGNEESVNKHLLLHTIYCHIFSLT